MRTEVQSHLRELEEQDLEFGHAWRRIGNRSVAIAIAIVVATVLLAARRDSAIHIRNDKCRIDPARTRESRSLDAKAGALQHGRAGL